MGATTGQDLYMFRSGRTLATMNAPTEPTPGRAPEPASSGAVRLVATVSVTPEVVAEAVSRAQAMLAIAPEVLTAEVGACRDVRTGAVVPGDYVISATFADHDALRRYATSDPHNEVHDWVVPYVVAEHVTVFEAGAVER